MTDSLFKIVLVTPEIPGNTGSIGRTALALNCELILIKPIGFDISEKAVRRAGLDYWKYVQLKEYDSFEAFLELEAPTRDKLFFFSKNASQNYFQASFQKDSYFIFGPETKGLSASMLKEYEDRVFGLPMYSDKIRSLNLANAATAVLYEGIRQLKFS